MPIIAKKSLGQHFLTNPRILEKIVSAAEISPKETVVEIGPGTGTLTDTLLKHAGEIIAVEKDHRLIKQLKEKFAHHNRVIIIEGDALTFDPHSAGLFADSYTIVANLPYYITSHFIRVALERWPRPKLMVLMVQKEVAQRIVAQPPDMNLLALSVQLYGNAEIVGSVSRGNFKPVPQVDSTIIKITPHSSLLLGPSDQKSLFRLAKAGFSGKRKMLVNTLLAPFGKSKQEISELLSSLGIEPSARPEELSLQHWILLARETSEKR